MTDAPEPDARLAQLVETWHRACTDFVALAREIPPRAVGPAHRPRGLERQGQRRPHRAPRGGAGRRPRGDRSRSPEAPHLKGLMSYYTEQGVLARRDRDMESLADEIEQAVATRHAALQADPPTDPNAAPPKTPGDVPWDYQTLLSNRPVRRVDARAGHPARDRSPRRATTRPPPRTCCAPSGARCRWSWASASPHRRGRPSALEVPEAGLGWTVRRRRRRAGGRRSTTTGDADHDGHPEPGGLRRPRRWPAPSRGDPAADRGRRGARTPRCSSRWRSPRDVGGLDPRRHPRPDRQARAGHRRHQRHRRVHRPRAGPPRGRGHPRRAQPGQAGGDDRPDPAARCPARPCTRSTIDVSDLASVRRAAEPGRPSRSTCWSTTPA